MSRSCFKPAGPWHAAAVVSGAHAVFYGDPELGYAKQVRVASTSRPDANERKRRGPQAEEWRLPGSVSTVSS
jgi:hypothetical protein